jgi:hypothetical protein
LSTALPHADSSDAASTAARSGSVTENLIEDVNSGDAGSGSMEVLDEDGFVVFYIHT